jgi:hypothetical protein
MVRAFIKGIFKLIAAVTLLVLGLPLVGVATAAFAAVFAAIAVVIGTAVAFFVLLLGCALISESADTSDLVAKLRAQLKAATNIGKTAK